MEILTTEILKNRINDFLTELETDHTNIGDYIDADIITDYETAFDEISDELNNNNSLDVEIIYYSRAIDYLKENDCSLQESLSIASEYGYTSENLNSEVLASLLASQNNREQFYELETEITDFFNVIIQDVEEFKAAAIEFIEDSGKEIDEDLEDLDIDELSEIIEELI